MSENGHPLRFIPPRYSAWSISGFLWQAIVFVVHMSVVVSGSPVLHDALITLMTTNAVGLVLYLIFIVINAMCRANDLSTDLSIQNTFPNDQWHFMWCICGHSIVLITSIITWFTLPPLGSAVAAIMGFIFLSAPALVIFWHVEHRYPLPASTQHDNKKGDLIGDLRSVAGRNGFYTGGS